MILKQYTKEDTSIIKGTAIILICLHNFFHWLPPSPGENEFLFFGECIGNLFSMTGEKPLEIINLLFSYFGHFGVQLFLFISGYGLAKSMAKNEKSWLPFFWDRIKKIYPLLLVGILFLFLTITFAEGRLLTRNEHTELLYKLLFIHTLIPKSALTLNGPWWFFALIIQLYVLFPIIYHLNKKYGWKSFIVICLISYAIIYTYKFNIRLYDGEMIMMNFPGHLPEFCLGVLLASDKEIKLNPIWLIASIILFVLGNFYIYFYPFTFLAITIITIYSYQGLKSLHFSRQALKRFLIYFGELSMAIFAVHGALRQPILKFANTYDNAWWHLLSGIVFFITVWCAAMAAEKIYNIISKPLSSVSIKENKASRIAGRIILPIILLLYISIATFYTYAAFDIKDKDQIYIGEVPETGTITETDLYYRIARCDIRKPYTNFQIEGSLEYKGDYNQGSIPIVLEIPGFVWEKFDIPLDNTNDDFKEFHFSYNLTNPIIAIFLDSPIKIYFWNHKNISGEYRNLNITISH